MGVLPRRASGRSCTRRWRCTCATRSRRPRWVYARALADANRRHAPRLQGTGATDVTTPTTTLSPPERLVAALAFHNLRRFLGLARVKSALNRRGAGCRPTWCAGTSRWAIELREAFGNDRDLRLRQRHQPPARCGWAGRACPGRASRCGWALPTNCWCAAPTSSPATGASRARPPRRWDAQGWLPHRRLRRALRARRARDPRSHQGHSHHIRRQEHHTQPDRKPAQVQPLHHRRRCSGRRAPLHHRAGDARP